MHKVSVCVVTCFVGLLPLTQIRAQSQPQSTGLSAAESVPVSDAPQNSVPRVIRFSGALDNSAAKPNGPAGVEFAIYREQTGGTSLWSEIQNVDLDATGRFTVLLGATKNGGLPPDVLGIGETRWLGVSPSGGPEAPRMRLVSVPYALRAEEALRIAGAPASDFVRKANLTDSVREAIRTAQSGGSAGPAKPSAQSDSFAASGPTTFVGNNATQIVNVKQNGAGQAIVAKAPTGIGTSSSGGTAGVFGTATAANGIGVQGSVSAPSGSGVSGVNNATTGNAFGVGGTANSLSANAAGVNGYEAAASGQVYGVNGNTGSAGPGAAGVNGFEDSLTGQVSGVHGTTNSAGSGSSGVLGYEGASTGQVSGLSGSAQSSGQGSAAVAGFEGAASGQVFGVNGGTNSGGGSGVYGYNNSTAGGYGVSGYSASASGVGVSGSNGAGGLAGSFSGGVSVTGNLNVTGTITAGTKDFRIDDPLDPARKYLYHASIESSEMANIYSGNVVLDRKGEAFVNLPEWFEALNGDFRYQLTAIGRAAPVYIAEEIQNHRFKIAGGPVGTKVSWQVTGVRHDPWAEAHPLHVEAEKTQP